MLAHFYPGIERGYTAWDSHLKQAYIDNIPHVIASIDYQRRQVATDTIDGLYRATLARTGDLELAERVKQQVGLDAKLAATGS